MKVLFAMRVNLSLHANDFRKFQKIEMDCCSRNCSPLLSLLKQNTPPCLLKYFCQLFRMSSLWWRFFKKRTTKTTTATVTSTPSSACASTNNNNTKSNKRSSPVIIKKYAYSPPSRGLPSGETGDGKVFGVELEKSLSYASVAISMVGP